ncbi:MAG TPA: glycoside hydrolase family 97 N-terminal domain-containing protein, partial [Gemmatimonadaceae bacterium]
MKMYAKSWTRGMTFAALLMTLTAAAAIAQDTLSVSSPDGRNKVGVTVNDGKLYYILSRDGRPLLLPSMLGFEFRGAPTLRDGLRITGSSHSTFDQTWTQPWGEVSHVRDHHNELRVSVAETAAPGRKFDFVVRAFNDGIGFRYEVPAQPALGDFVISDELTQFNFADNAKSWWIPSNRPRLDRSEFLYSSSPVSVTDSIQTPFTLETRDGKTFMVI